MDDFANIFPKGGFLVDWVSNASPYPDNSPIFTLQDQSILTIAKAGNYVIEWLSTNGPLSINNVHTDEAFEYYISDGPDVSGPNTVVNGLANPGNWICFSAPSGGPSITALTQLYVTVVLAPAAISLSPLRHPTALPTLEWPCWSGLVDDSSLTGYLTTTTVEVYSSP